MGAGGHDYRLVDGLIDGTITNVALPQIQRRLEAIAVDAQWIVEAYALFLAALILVGGSLGDHYGRRRSSCSALESSRWRQLRTRSP